MSFVYTYDGANPSVNLTSTNYLTMMTDMLYYFKQTLKQAGWTVPRSSDGLTYNATGDQITHSGTGAGGMNNNYAWFVLRQPGSVSGATRELLLQRYSTSNQMNVYYSYNAGFIGGTPNATSRPTATDQKDLTSNIWPLFTRVNVKYRYHIAADNSPPYGFYMFSMPLGGGEPQSGFVMDPMLTGTYNSLDVDPYIFYLPHYSSTQALGDYVIPFRYGHTGTAGVYANGSRPWYASLSTEDAGFGGPLSFLQKGKASESWRVTPALGYCDGSSWTQNVYTQYPNNAAWVYIGIENMTVPNSFLINPYTLNDTVYPIPYGVTSRAVPPYGFKGFGSLMKWVGTSTNRSTGDVLTLSSGTNMVVVGDVALPWNNGAVSV